MKTVVVPQPGAAFISLNREIPEPGAGAVRLKVEACGICHSDSMVKEGHWPGLEYPRAPGHEVAGTVDAVGPAVTGWKPGDRAGIGWHGDHCGQCDACRSGDFLFCASGQITGFTFDGGYQQYMLASVKGLARIPDSLPFAEAAPLLCAGVTTFNSLRHSGAVAGDLVAVHGIGGLGHLGVQFARYFGFRVAAISRGADKEELALRLGAHRYIDSSKQDAAAELAKMGGARVILATAPSGAAISTLTGGLGRNGKLLIVAAPPDPIQVNAGQLIGGRKSIQGWAAGTSRDSEDTLNFCALAGIRPMIEIFPLADAAAAYERMLSNRARFRVVLVPS
jgi:D-arabinose 1-dehydrogenase-like Zn-dependent alcohol dehydrogenase